MIIVHDGKAHVDDFLATCILLHKLNCRAIRTKCTQEHLDDPNCWVIDQGRIFDTNLHNFDHHQIQEEICAATMVLDYFYGKKYRELFPQYKFIEIMDSYGPKAAAKFLKTDEEIFDYCYNPICGAMIDIFSDVNGDLTDPLYTIMKKIGSSICKIIENTDKLLKVIEKDVTFEKIHIRKSNEEKNDFFEINLMNLLKCKVEEGFGIENLPTKKYCKINKLTADVILTIDTRVGGYRMISSNTDKLKFLPNEKSSFTHNSGFLTTFKNISDYSEILKNYTSLGNKG